MPTTYALLSTYPPTQCGLATFSAALLAHLPETGDHIAVVRVLDEPVPGLADKVVHDLVNGSAASAAVAAEVLNGFDVVIVQHEYGIYGGPDGQDVISLLEALYVPCIVILHTVLAHPTPRQRMILDEVIAAAGAVVTMTETARSRLLDIYGTSPEKVLVIPHGAAGNRVAASPAGNTDRPKVLTWGLPGPGKGIEHATEPGLSARMSRHSADLAPQLLWPAVASSYRELASALTMTPAGAAL
jgi:polysaccharide biosynthesis protein PslF